MALQCTTSVPCSAAPGPLTRRLFSPRGTGRPPPDAPTTILYSNGDRFEGQVEGQKRQGLGWYFYQNGDIYFGHWKADIKEGFGVLQYRSGDRYVGTFAANRKNGFGEYSYAGSGDVYQGFWEGNNKSGFGRIFSANRNEFRGVFKANKKDGKGFLYTREGKVFLQVWNNDTFVKQQAADEAATGFGEFDFEAVFAAEAARMDLGLVRRFEERLGQLGRKMVPDKPESSVQASQRNSSGRFEARSGSLRGGVSGRLSRIDSLSLIDYTDRLKSLFGEKELRAVKEWTPRQVGEFLDKISLGEYSPAFETAGIDGALVLKMQEADFKSLGILARGDLIKIADYIEKLKILTNQDEYRRNLLDRKLIPESLVSEKLISRYDVETERMIEEKSWESSESDASRTYPRHRKFEFGGKNESPSGPRGSKFDPDGGHLSHTHNPKMGKKASQDKEAERPNFVFDAFSEKNPKKVQSFTMDHDGSEDFDASAKNEEEKRPEKPFGVPRLGNGLGHPSKPVKHSLSSESDEDLGHGGDLKPLTLRQDYSDSDPLAEEVLKLGKKKSARAAKKKGSNFSALAKKYEIQKRHLTLDEKLSEGAFGMVYKGKYLHQTVAVKVYKRLKDTRFHIRSFLKEVEILSRLRHPDVLLYIGVCIDGDDCYMVSEYLENGSLFDHLHGKKRKTPLDSARIHELLKGILRALTYVHGKGIVHCDLKSSNILIDDSWTIKLADFGLSKKIIGVNVLDKNHKSRVGTPNWMAPEICRGESYTPEADVYSFGLVVWEIVTNSVPFRDKSPDEIIALVGQAKSHPVS